MDLSVVIRTVEPTDAPYLAELGARTFRAAFAANGIITDSGSALLTLADTAQLGQLDIEFQRENTEIERTGLINRSNDFLAESALLTFAGHQDVPGLARQVEFAVRAHG